MNVLFSFSGPAPIVIVLLAMLPLGPQLTAGQVPNVVLLLADDLGSKDLGCYGGPVKTPVLDRLAANGVRFTDFHAGAAVCSPSRATLLTGRQNLRTGIYGVLQDQWHDMHLLEREVTLAEVLQAIMEPLILANDIGMSSGKRVSHHQPNTVLTTGSASPTEPAQATRIRQLHSQRKMGWPNEGLLTRLLSVMRSNGWKTKAAPISHSS